MIVAGRLGGKKREKGTPQETNCTWPWQNGGRAIGFIENRKCLHDVSDSPSGEHRVLFTMH